MTTSKSQGTQAHSRRNVTRCETDFESLGRKWRAMLDGECIAIREYIDGKPEPWVVGRRAELLSGKLLALAPTSTGMYGVPANEQVIRDGLGALDHACGRKAGARPVQTPKRIGYNHWLEVRKRRAHEQANGPEADPRDATAPVTKWVGTQAAAKLAGCTCEALYKRYQRGLIPRTSRKYAGAAAMWDESAVKATVRS